MTKNILSIVALLFATNSFASSTVCSGEKLYTSDVRADFGIQPHPGMVTGHHLIFFNGEVLQSYESTAGSSTQYVPSFQVRNDGEQRVLEATYGGAIYQKVYEVTAVLERVDSLARQVIEELGREQVICREIQKMVP